MPASFKISPLPSLQTTYNLIWQTESLSRIHEYKLRFRKVPSGNVTPNNRFAYIPWTEFVIPSENSAGPIHGMGYTLKGLVAGSVYEVIVLARNKYGWSDESKVLRFATTGESK
jgi:neurotrimin